jgi:hypothetical protein
MNDKQEIVCTFEDMVEDLRDAIRTFVDKRTGKNTQYEIMDAAVGAFSVFFTQCPSFLSHQKLLQARYGLSNARTLFGMKDIPGDNHIRDLLDPTIPSALGSVFDRCFDNLDKSGHLDSFKVSLVPGKKDILIALDGTEYYSSGTLHCKNCSIRKREGVVRYCHGMVTPTIVAPGNNKVISLAPSFITPQDGDDKQDCEIKASKRWLKTYIPQHNSAQRNSTQLKTNEGITILGDDLYAHEPFCKELLDKGVNFIFTCKPDSHKTVYEWIKGITKEQIVDRFDGKRHQIYTYKFVEGIPIRDGKQSLAVNFVEVTVKDRQTQEQIYHNAFITNLPLQGETDQETEIILGTIVDCGRARWKIENENNNTLKTKGYHLEHNFGHGQKNLASLLATMNLLAFLFHTMLEFMNKKYKLLRKVLGARKRFFNDIRTLLVYLPFKSFDNLMLFMVEGLKERYDLETLKVPV